MNRPEYIVLHHSFTEDNTLLSDYEAIRNYHMNVLGFEAIAYHYVVERVDGKPVTRSGRWEGQVGAHTREMGMNRRSLGVCVVGNYDIAPPDNEMLKELVKIIWVLKVGYGIPASNVIGHREAGAMAGYDWRKGQFKTCPGRSWDMDALRKMVRGGEK